LSKVQLAKGGAFLLRQCIYSALKSSKTVMIWLCIDLPPMSKS